ncbi:sphingosine kinase [Scheffersomyces amazonensis]|uniref:sphingosine kinase n=1 Tax=Scheffersomyces amazonensis TaxID=1078765 RepID=UPI00315C6972
MSSERLLYEHTDLIESSLGDSGIKVSEQYILALHAEQSQKSSFFSYCFPTSTPSFIDQIPYRNILWCSVLGDGGSNQDELELVYVSPRHKKSVEIKTIHIQIKGPLHEQTSAQQLVDHILSKSYKNHIVSPSILVIINPHGGRGEAVQVYQKDILPVLTAANAKISYVETEYSQHAVEIARTMDIEKYDIIACCSGDGIPHEVINGFFKREDRGVKAFNKIAVTQLPCGSGNAFSLSTHGSNDASLATFHMLKAHRTKLDLMAVTQGVGSRKSTKLSFLSQCYGIIADSDIGTEHLRWMGPIRFDLGVAQRVIQRSKYPCDVYVEYVTRSKKDIVDHFDSHYSRNEGFVDFERESMPYELPLITENDLEVSGPELNQPPPASWTKLAESVSKNLNILYVGKMPYISNDVQFFPAALPNDGTMDMIVTDTNTSIIETTSILSSLDRGLHVHNEKVHHSKILSYRLAPRLSNPKNHYISVDGESFPFEPLQVEVLPGILTSLLQDGKYVETCFTK